MLVGESDEVRFGGSVVVAKGEWEKGDEDDVEAGDG